MPRGKTLTSEEIAKIEVYKELGISNREIAKKLNRSRCLINNYIRKGKNYGTLKRPGRPPLVTQRQKREIKRVIHDENLSARNIKHQLDLQIGVRRLQQIMSKDLDLSYEKKLGKPLLTPRHKLARLRFAEKYRFWDYEWKNVVFSDEKTFNLDGPDGVHKYWRNKHCKKANRHRRNFGGGSLMVWAGISYRGTTPICFVSTKMDSDYYIDLLDNVLVHYGEELLGPEFIFQQDNAAIHRSRKTIDFLNSRKIQTLDWPAISPDLNPVENMWSLLSANVFANGRQFSTVKSLKMVIEEEWRKISPEYIHSLINSMPRRLEEVINNGGGHTSY